MKPMNLDQVVGNIDRRLEWVEQILPTLPTRDEMHTALDTAIRGAVAPLATREELDRNIAPLATKDEIRGGIRALAKAHRDSLREPQAPHPSRR
jgi:hypothetical protein